MNKHGVFISYRHKDWALAGRIYDFFDAKGMRPFLYTESMHQGHFQEQLRQEILQAPYYLCVLTENTFAPDTENASDRPYGWVYKELEIALTDPDKKILMVAEKGFQWPAYLPVQINTQHRIRDFHFDSVESATFRNQMEKLWRKNIERDKLSGVLDWRQQIFTANNVCMMKREQIEKELAPLADRFGWDLIAALKENREYEGENRIRSIRMSCYAASIIFTPEQNKVDMRAFDKHLMAKLFGWLLKDPDFNMEIIINAPGSTAMWDAITRKKLGNSSQEICPEDIFYSSYGSITHLIQNNPVFTKAYEDNRFNFMVTENMLPYALFHVEYKTEFEEYSYIKVDLYSEGLTSNMDRRCMMIFKRDDPQNYNFFVERYNYTRDARQSGELIRQHHVQWMQEWEELKKQKEGANGIFGIYPRREHKSGTGEEV